MTELSLSELLRSTRDLHERFGVPFRVDVSERLVAEESYELLRASVSFQALERLAPHRVYKVRSVDYRRDVAFEAVDLFVVTLALLQAHDVTDDMLAQAIEHVIAKNDAKNWVSHDLVNGKITRREPTTPDDGARGAADTNRAHSGSEAG